MRLYSIARFTEAKEIVGVTISPYQANRANTLNAKHGMDHICKAEQGDFMHLGIYEEYDCAYAIESTCHAPDRVVAFQQIFDALKPGGMFGCFEWAMTALYDPGNPEHRKIKHEIEKGDGLPSLSAIEEIVESMRLAGFEITDTYDIDARTREAARAVPWYATLQGGCSISQMKHSRMGRFFTQKAVEVLEILRIAPRGTSATHQMLSNAAEYLVRGGQTGIFTPMLFILAKKPIIDGENVQS